MSKKLTIANMNAIAGVHLPTANFTYTVKDGSEITITIDPNVSLSQISNFVDSVVEAVFTVDGDYIPEYRDLATFIAVIRELSNIPLPTKDANVDVVACYKWMLATNLLNKLEERDDEIGIWFFDITQLITSKIEFKKQEIMAKHQSNYSYFEGKLEELISAFSRLGEQYADLDINETIDIARKIARKDEAQIVNAVIDIAGADQNAQAKKPV